MIKTNILSESNIDWVIIALAIVGVIIINLLIGLIVFLCSLPLEKKVNALLDPLNELIYKKTKDVDSLLKSFLEEYETPLIDFTPYIDQLTLAKDISTLVFIQKTILILIKKDIASEKILPSQNLKDSIDASSSFEELESKSLEYNKKAMRYNALKKFIFAKPFFYFAHKKQYTIL